MSVVRYWINRYDKSAWVTVEVIVDKRVILIQLNCYSKDTASTLTLRPLRLPVPIHPKHLMC